MEFFNGKVMFVISAWALMAVALLYPHSIHSQCEPMQFANVNGRSVAYHLLGNATGTPLIFINGGPGFDHSFHHLSKTWQQLSRSRRIIFFDQPGTGKSWPVGPNDSLSVDDLLLSIEAIRNSINASRFSLIGHSWGGYVALAYAIRYPERLERLVLVNSVAPKISETTFLFAALFPEVQAQRSELRADNPADVQKYIRLSLAMSFHSPKIRKRVLKKTGTVKYNGHQENLLWKDAENHDLSNDLKLITIPVLVTTGRYDANIAPRTSWAIHQEIKNSTFIVFERSGHFPMIEEPENFFSVIDIFLRGGK